jgi:hypothetical protein
MSNPPRYGVGDTAPGGLKIVQIYGQTESVLVYLAEDKVLGHYIDEDHVSEQTSKVLKTYHEIRNAAFRVYPKDYWDTLQDELGAALFNGLSAPDLVSASSAFDEIRGRIAEKRANRGRYRYLIATSAAALTLLLIGWLLRWILEDAESKLYAACMIFAVSGAFASVITRSSSVMIDPTEDQDIVVLRGIYRILLAILLTAFMLAAAKANLVAGIVMTTPATLLAYSFLCGFSERFVPEILANLESKKPKVQGSRKSVQTARQEDS